MSPLFVSLCLSLSLFLFPPSLALSLPFSIHTERKGPMRTQWDDSYPQAWRTMFTNTKNQIFDTLILNFQTVRNKCQSFKPPSLWNCLTEAWGKRDYLSKAKKEVPQPMRLIFEWQTEMINRDYFIFTEIYFTLWVKIWFYSKISLILIKWCLPACV